jgi:hypothetical protein
MEIGGRTEREAGKIVAEWLQNGVLVKSSYYHAASKHTVDRVCLDEAKVREILAEIQGAGAPPE